MTGYESKKKAAQDKLTQDAFNDWWGSDYDDSTNPCIEGTPVYWAWAGWHAALAQPAQEPVTWAGVDFDINTTPPQRPWVGLTDKDRMQILDATEGDERGFVMKLVEDKLKEKNT